MLPDALTYMVAAMANDITIMGLCGETRIANKRASCNTLLYPKSQMQSYLTLRSRGHRYPSL